MTSDYERKRFRRNYILVAAIFLAVSFLVLGIIFYACDFERGAVIYFVLIGALEVAVLFVLYKLCAREVGRAYYAVEKTANMMVDLMQDSERELVAELDEGSIGILNSNFEKLVNMFREGKRKEAEEKEFLKDVMSDISHQLKTPLASLNIFIDLLLNDKLDSEEERKKVLREAENQMTRMQWMVLSMLKLARIEARVIDFNIRRASVSAVLDEVRGAVRYLLDAKNQKLTVEFEGDGKADSGRDAEAENGSDSIAESDRDIYVLADPEWLTEALINIVKNASDYSGEGSSIEIHVEANSVFARIYIRDHGIGIPESELPNIFKRFYRVSSEVNPNSVGIGLALSKSIVEGMDGQIRVNSTVGEGTEFQVQLPAAE
ncbi:MAG: HAMP domain-containing histidine kinase [Eubacterium sp.]|nr:HAMP domain-containing histidine kinase [Eubacterium sp.]